MTDNINTLKVNDFLIDYNNFKTIDINKAINIIKTYPKNDWHISILEIWNDTYDYSVYNDEYYFCEVWFSWSKYARKYINQLIKCDYTNNFLKNNNSCLDLGNGLGLSSIYLKQQFNNLKVYGSNIKDTTQWNYNLQNTKKYDYDMISDLNELDNIDIIFASEYFEHIQNPIEHLKEVLKLNPKMLVIANSFNTIAIGHFREYIINDELINEKLISRKFNKYLRDNGYTAKKLKFWNNRPAVWVKNNL
jgi:hypothetical protein